MANAKRIALLGGVCLVVVWFLLRPTSRVDRLTLPSCLDPVEAVFVAEVVDWPEQVRGIPSLRPEQVISVPTDVVGLMSPWTTDSWVFGWRGGRPTVACIPGPRGLAEWGENYFQTRNWPLVSLGQKRASPLDRFDAGGNVLVAPGRFRTGSIITAKQIQPAMREWLRSASSVPLVELDTSWLKVGHVDEIVSFVPGDRNTGPRFRLVLPDFLAGLRLLESVPVESVLFAAQNGKCRTGTVSASGARFLEDAGHDLSHDSWRLVRIVSGPQAGLVGRVFDKQGHRLAIGWSWDLRGESATRSLGVMRAGRCDTMPLWKEPPEPGSRYVAVEDSLMWLDGAGEEVPALITAGELRRDAELLQLAKECAQRINGPGGVRETLTHAMGIRPEDIIWLPMLVRGDVNQQNVTALIPNPINLVCLGDQVICLKPHGPRSDPTTESSDVFLHAWQTAFHKVGLKPDFLEGWNSLHRLDGGVRCGINVLRRTADCSIASDNFAK